MIYLDNHKTTRPSSKVVAIMEKELWLDPSAPYFKDMGLLMEIEKGIKHIYDLTGASEEAELIVTSGEFDAANRVFQRILQREVYGSGKNFLFAPIIENASIRRAMEGLEPFGCVLRYLPLNANGELTVEILEKYITPKAGALALSWANPLTGVIHPIEEIGNFCKERGITLYVQGSEMFAKLFMRLEELPIDYFSFSADLFHGPKGIGGLLSKEKRRRLDLYQVPNIPGLLGMGCAAGEVLDFMDGMSTEVAYMRSLLEGELLRKIPKMHVFGSEAKRLPSVLAFAIPGIHGELLTFLLSQKGIFVSYGGGRVQKLEYHLLEMGIEPSLAKSAISVALSMDTSEKEIYDTVAAIEEIAREWERGAL